MAKLVLPLGKFILAASTIKEAEEAHAKSRAFLILKCHESIAFPEGLEA